MPVSLTRARPRHTPAAAHRSRRGPAALVALVLGLSGAITLAGSAAAADPAAPLVIDDFVSPAPTNRQAVPTGHATYADGPSGTLVSTGTGGGSHLVTFTWTYTTPIDLTQGGALTQMEVSYGGATGTDSGGNTVYNPVMMGLIVSDSSGRTRSCGSGGLAYGSGHFVSNFTQQGAGDLRYLAGNASLTSVSSITLTVGSVGNYDTTSVSVLGISAVADETDYTLATFSGPSAISVQRNGTVDATVTATGYPRPTLATSGTLPTGVTVTKSGTSIIFGGAPTQTGTFVYTIAATTSESLTTTHTVTFNVFTKPSVDASSTFTARVGQAFSQTLTVGGDPLPTTARTTFTPALPTGLSGAISGTTLTISGTPTGAPGLYSGTVTVGNDFDTATGALTITVQGQATLPAITNALTEVGKAITPIVITGGGYPAPGVTVTGLPTGLLATPTTGGTTITGTPSATGTSTVTVTADNGIGAAVSTTFTITVASRPTISAPTPINTTVGVAVVDIPVTMTGFPAPTAVAVAPGLPAGLTLSKDAGGAWAIRGTPTSAGMGTTVVTLQADNALSTATTTIAVVVSGAPTISGPTTLDLSRGAAMAPVTFTAGGYPPPLMTLKAGQTLPDGLEMANPLGSFTLSGTPTTTGVWDLTVVAQNGTGTVEQTVRVTVGTAPVFAEDSVALSVRANVDLDTHLAATSSPSHTVSILSGSLPAGMTLAPDGRLSGRAAPSAAGRYQLTVQAANAFGTDTLSLTIDILTRPDIAGAAPDLPELVATAGSPVTYTFVTTGWDPPTVTALDPLPEGLTLSQSATDPMTWQITGTAPREARGGRTVRLAVTNAYGVVVTRYLDVTVNATLRWETPATGRTIITERGVPITPIPVHLTGYPVPGGFITPGSTGLSVSQETWTSTEFTGTIVGTPTSSRWFSICFARGTTCTGPTLTMNFVVQDRPLITTTSAVTAAAGTPVSIPVTVTGSPAATLTAAGLPAGLSLTPVGAGSWAITGTPDRTVLGEHTITLTADNGLKRTTTVDLTVTGVPVLTSVSPITTPVGQPLARAVVTATGYPLPDFTVTAGTLPPGLSLDDDHGTLVVSGTPTTAGSFTVAIAATSTSGGASTSLTINVVEPPQLAQAGPVSLSAREGDPFSYSLTTTGYPAPEWTLTGTLPAGLSFSNGVISGTPTVGSADGVSGHSALTLTVTNDYGSDDVALSLSVDSAPKFPAGLPTATFASGTAGSYAFTTGGWDRPTVTLLDALPAGLSLTDAGDADPTTWAITGTVARELMGPHTVHIALDNAFGVRTTGTLTIDVTAPFVWQPVTTDVVVETGKAITAVDLVGTGYPLPMDYEMGIVPGWVTYSHTIAPNWQKPTSITYTLVGTPLTAGTETVTVKPAFGLGAPVSVTFHVTDRPAFTAPSTQTVLTDTAVDIPFTVSGSPASVVTATGLPTGLSVVAGTAPGEWHITGTAGRASFGTHTVTLTARNGLEATADVTLVVEGVPVLNDATVTTYVGRPATEVVHATGDPLPTLAVTAGDLPPGLNAADDEAGGLAFTGTPTVPGAWPVTVTATNGNGADSATVTVEVRSAPFFTATSIEQTLREGDPVDFPVEATGFPAPRFEILSGTLPAGLAISADGRITGTPAAGSADAGSGRYELVLRAWNDEGVDTLPVTLVVLSAPSVPGGLATMRIDADAAASYTFTTGGWDRPTVTLLDALPDGLSLGDAGDTDPTTWQITGTVARALRGPHTVHVALDNSFGRVVQTLQIEVTAPFVWGEAPSTVVVETGVPITPLRVTSTGYVVPQGFSVLGWPSWLLPSNVTWTNTEFDLLLVGTPPTAGPALFSLRPQGASGPDLRVMFLVTDRPVITAPATVTTTAGDAVAIDVSVSGSPVSDVTATGLPAGLTLVPGATTGTWQITGTPGRDVFGEHTITLTADNGLTATQDLTLTVNGGALLTAPTQAVTMRLGQPVPSVTWTATGYPAPDVELVGDLPPGVVATTGPSGLTLEGTPTTQGTWTVDIQTTNAYGTDAVTVYIVVADLPAFADDTVDLVMIEGVPTTTSLPLRGFPEPTVDVVGAIPGLTVTHTLGSDPVLSGTPEAGSAGDYTLTLTARNMIAGVEQTDVVTVNVRVDARAAITAGTDALVTTVGTAVDRTIAVGGAPEPTLTAAGLPAGLTLTRTDAGLWHLSGTPAAGTGGVHAVTLTATNGVLDAATATLQVTVREPVTAVRAPAAALRVGTAGSVTVSTSGGWPTPPTLRIEGPLPRGLSFVDNGNGTGRVAGTPAAGTVGTWTVAVVADNGVGVTRASLKLTVADAPASAPLTTTDGTSAGDGAQTDQGTSDGTGGTGGGDSAGDGSGDGSGASDGDGTDDAPAATPPAIDVPVTVSGPGVNPWWWALASLLVVLTGTGAMVYRRLRGH